MEQSKLFSTATLFFCILLVFFVKKLGKERNNSTPKLPPGPWKLPIIGSLIHLIGDQPHHRLSSLAKIYGPLFQLKLGEIDFMIISSAELACEVMKTHDINFASRPQITVGKVVFYNSSDIIFSPYGKYWWNLRKICSMHIFSAKRVKSFGSMRVEEANKLMEKIRVAAGSPVNLSELFSSAANAAVSRASFGRECGHMQKFLLAVDEMRKLSSGFELADLFPSLSFLGGLTGLTSRLERAHSCWDAILNEIIEEHLIKSGEGKDMDELIVDVLLRLREDKELDMHLTMDNIKAVISDLFVAGTETTSTFMDWAMTELIRHPHVMRKAQSEVRRYSNGGTGAQEWEINKLPYLSCIMKETFRLHPAAPLLVPRVGRETVDLFGYAVPAGSRVLINVGAIMRDPKYWDDPESFRPERFEGSAVDFKGANFEYTPFGAGRRICPGMAFAISNIEQWLAPLLCYFDWGLPDGRRAEELDVEESFGGAVSRKHDLIVVATPYMPAM